MDKIRIKLDTHEELLVAKWASQWLDGYLENLQDDQSRCYRCGEEEDLHPLKLNNTFGMYLGIGTHEYVGEWPEFRTEFEVLNPDGTAAKDKYWVIAKQPEIILEYLVDTILDQDYKEIDLDDFEHEYGDKAPAVAVAHGLISKIFEQYPELSVPYRRFKIVKPDGQPLDPKLPLWAIYDMDFNSQTEVDAILKMNIGDSFTEDDGVTTIRVS